MTKLRLLFIHIATTIVLSTTSMASTPSADAFSAAKTPDIPSNVSFAGQHVSLDETDMYERFDRELTSMVYTHGNTLLVIKRANKFFPVIVPILKKYGIPADLAYLACIESTLDPTAVSPAKAAGLWQFMPATGREYGLEVNDNVDERFHVEKSTEAACKYLKRAYEKYGNWESVAASYNGGQGRISRELASQQVTSAFDLHLVSETSRYMFRLLAMKEIMSNPAHYGFRLKADQLYQPVKYNVAEVDSTVSNWPEWAKAQGIDYLTLRLHNPWIRSRQLPNPDKKVYTVMIPTQESRRRSTGIKSVFNNKWITRQ